MVKVKIRAQDVPPLGDVTDITFLGEGFVRDERTLILVPSVAGVSFLFGDKISGYKDLRWRLGDFFDCGSLPASLFAGGDLRRGTFGQIGVELVWSGVGGSENKVRRGHHDRYEVRPKTMKFSDSQVRLTHGNRCTGS